MPLPPSALPADPRCSYDAIRAQYELRCQQVPPHDRSTAPLFLTAAGSFWTTEDVRSLARAWAPAVGIPPKETGGKSFRIKGATDIRAQYGNEHGARVVQERGRWGSDVSFIYSRSHAQGQLDASATMADAVGGSLEALIPTWTQPARRR